MIPKDPQWRVADRPPRASGAVAGLPMASSSCWRRPSPVGGAIVFKLVAIWVFGREYSDRTVMTCSLRPPRAIVGAVRRHRVLVARTDGARSRPARHRAPPSDPGREPRAGEQTSPAGLGPRSPLPSRWSAHFAWAGQRRLCYLRRSGPCSWPSSLPVIALGWGAYFPSVPALSRKGRVPTRSTSRRAATRWRRLRRAAGAAGTRAAWWRPPTGCRRWRVRPPRSPSELEGRAGRP